ncbi:MAG: SCO family protein [Hyphomicrobiales bacterium]|nr:SCO family protein [Hyphomicrobiales bacterium]
MRYAMSRRHFLLTLMMGLLTVIMAGKAGAAGDPTKTGGRFIMNNHFGEVVTDQDFSGKFLLIYFGYTFCPDVCPTSLQTMTHALNLMGKDAEYVQPLFVTVDPERDTISVMRDYVSAFHPSLIGLTGSKVALDSITSKYRVKYEKVSESGAINDDYLVDHTAAVLLMGPGGEYLTRYPYNTMADGMASSMKEYIKELIIK